MQPKNKVFTIGGAAYVLTDNQAIAKARARQHFGGDVSIGKVTKVGILYKISIRKKKGGRRR